MGAMCDTCCGKCADRCECIYETIPSVAIVGVVFSLVGYILTLECAPEIVSAYICHDTHIHTHTYICK